MPLSTDELLERLLAGIERELPGAVALRRRLHAQPELAHAEMHTAAAVAEELPVACATAAGTGRIARVGSAEGAAVAVRAELDGLPVAERTGAPFGAGGGVMHACGHDVHMAALVALTRAAHALARRAAGSARGGLPAERGGLPLRRRGARPRGAGGDRARGGRGGARPSGAALGRRRARSGGVVNASSDSVAITVTGEPTHAAYPHLGRDPILAIAQVVVALHAQVGRRIDPHGPAVLTVGVIEGGNTENVIPDAGARARLAARPRPEDRLALRADGRGGRQRASPPPTAVAAASTLVPGEPALENDPRIVALARELLAGAGLEPAPEWRSCGSDDFAFFGALAPLAMAFVGLDGADGFAGQAASPSRVPAAGRRRRRRGPSPRRCCTWLPALCFTARPVKFLTGTAAGLAVASADACNGYALDLRQILLTARPRPQEPGASEGVGSRATRAPCPVLRRRAARAGRGRGYAGLTTAGRRTRRAAGHPDGALDRTVLWPGLRRHRGENQRHGIRARARPSR